MLEAVAEECLTESVARAVMLVGPAGIGKSRVRYEFVRALQRQDLAWQVMIGRADLMLTSSPFGLVGEALRRQCDIRARDPLEARRAALLSRVALQVPPDRVEEVAMFQPPEIPPFDPEAHLKSRSYGDTP